MKWLSKTQENPEGWFFDHPKEDYAAILHCKRCGWLQRVDMCKRYVLTGYLGDSCCEPIFYLSCFYCASTLALIDERAGEFRPMLNLEEEGEFINPPSV